MNLIQAVCVGVITVDTIALVDKYPAADERVIAHEISRAGGGPAAVAAVALSRLGISSAIVGTIGDDADGKEVLRIFEKEGVDTSGISIGTTATAATAAGPPPAREISCAITRSSAAGYLSTSAMVSTVITPTQTA